MKKNWDMMPMAKSKVVTIVEKPLTKKEIREADAWMAEMYVKNIGRYGIRDWQERGRKKPLTTEGIEAAKCHVMAVKETGRQQCFGKAQWMKWAIWVVVGLAAMIVVGWMMA